MKRRVLVTLAISLALIAGVTACSNGQPAKSSSPTASAASGGGSHPDLANCHNTMVKDNRPIIQLYSWYPNLQTVIDPYNQAHKDVQVCWIQAGGADAYAAFNTAVEAGTGIPDVVQVESDQIPNFVLRKAITNIAPYGVDAVKSKYTDGAWAAVSSGKNVYAVPVDGGPMGLYYRKDILDKYGIAVPTTWAEFEKAAETLKADGFQGVATDFPFNSGTFVQSMLWQTGWRAFDYDLKDPSSISVNIDTAKGRKLVEYWLDLIKQGLVSYDDRGTTDYQTKMVNGGYAIYIAAAWGSKNIVGIQSSDPDAEWRAAPLPQWDSSKPVEVNWGGSNFAVTQASPDKKLATKVAMDILGDQSSWKTGVEQVKLFPTFKPMLNSSYFTDLADPAFGGQQMNKDVWLPAAVKAQQGGFGPIAKFFYDKLNENLYAAAEGKLAPDKVLATVQQEVEENLKGEGLTVK